MFQRRRVIESLWAGWQEPAARSLDGLLRAVEHFRGRQELSDDISVILLRRVA
jgi:serine phosphatase RsbU (regulator of sigma subunit)